MISDVKLSLLDNNRYQIPGLGTFSTCTRKATHNRAACKVAMFRACTELRDYVSGGLKPEVHGPHAKVTEIIIESMKNEEGLDIPNFGRMAVVPGKKPKLIFHASEEFNGALTNH